MIVNEENSNADLEIRWEFPLGEGTSENKESGLIRPLKYVMEKGKPLGNFVYVFYEENNHHYVLGTLCKGTKRLLFFPGEDVRELILKNKDGSNIGHVDHYTLEPNFESFHVTLKEKADKNKKIPKEKTWKIRDDLILWFVKQARSTDDFELCPSLIKTTFSVTDSDAKRRTELFVNARENSIFQTCKINDGLKKPYMINFEFFVSLNGKPNLSDIPIYYNKPSNPSPESRNQIISRTHNISIPKFEPIVSIRVTKIPGSHEYPWSYNSGAQFKNTKIVKLGKLN